MTYQIPGIPPNMSVLAAINAGLLPASTLVISSFGVNNPQPILQLINAGLLNASTPASSVTFAAPPGFAGPN